MIEEEEKNERREEACQQLIQHRGLKVEVKLFHCCLLFVICSLSSSPSSRQKALVISIRML